MLSSDTGCWLHLLCRPTEDVSAVLLEHIHILIVHNKFPTRITVLERKSFSAKNTPGTWAELDPPVTAQKNKMSCLRFVRVFARTVRICYLLLLEPKLLAFFNAVGFKRSRSAFARFDTLLDASWRVWTRSSNASVRMTSQVGRRLNKCCRASREETTLLRTCTAYSVGAKVVGSGARRRLGSARIAVAPRSSWRRSLDTRFVGFQQGSVFTAGPREMEGGAEVIKLSRRPFRALRRGVITPRSPERLCVRRTQ